jgi:hypothetical protein
MTTKPNPMASLEEEVDDAADRMAAEVKTARTKVSVELMPRQYFKLLDFTAAATKARGKRVTNVDVYRALGAELFEDEELQARVIARIRGEK